MGTERAALIPWRGGCPHREAALRWLLPRLEAAGLRPIIGEPPAGPWSKARAVAAALEQTDAELLVVHDADVWAEGLGEALEAVAAGAAWAVPHRSVLRLAPEATEAVLAGGELEGRLAERPYLGHPGGGIVALPRSSWAAAPLDPRFLGWGHEDDAWAIALAGLAGPAWRGSRPLWHLWHPPQPRASRRSGSRESAALFARYRSARRSAAALAELIAEAQEAADAD